MGNRGPKRHSASWATLNGSHEGENRGLPTPPGVPVKPAWIVEKPIASAKWEEVIADLQEIPGLLSTLDGGALSLYCDAWQQFHDAQALVAAQGMVCQSEKGGTYQHPAVGIANKARAEITKLGSMFGLNPTAREGMIVSGRTEDDELADLIR